MTSWLPVYSEGEVVSWTLDFMRRNPEPSTVSWSTSLPRPCGILRNRGVHFPLGFPPGRSSGSSDSSLDRILALLARTLEPVYGFASLANFKQRFKPRHSPLYLMYQDPLSLPAIGRRRGGGLHAQRVGAVPGQDAAPVLSA